MSIYNNRVVSLRELMDCGMAIAYPGGAPGRVASLRGSMFLHCVRPVSIIVVSGTLTIRPSTVLLSAGDSLTLRTGLDYELYSREGVRLVVVSGVPCGLAAQLPGDAAQQFPSGSETGFVPVAMLPHYWNTESEIWCGL